MVWGAMVSTVKLREAGVGSALPAGSTARTSKVCAPCARELYGCGEVQASKSASWVESRRHSKLAPASEEKANDGEASLVRPEGPESIVVWGATVSTVKLCEAGLGSGFPAASTALTSKVWEPSERLE